MTVDGASRFDAGLDADARRRRWRARLLALLVGICLFLSGGGPRNGHLVEVTATAYNGTPEQTDSDPGTAAWGDDLEPGMRAIAVSRDLVREGFDRGTHVWIEGLGHFVVLDVMARRWRNKIDIYMGDDVEAANEFGRQEVRVFRPER